MTRAIEDALEAFLLESEELEELEGRLGSFNIFEAMGHIRAEERHSDFLSFLLDPNAPHGLADRFLTKLIQEALKILPPELRSISLGEIALADLANCLVLREFHQIDVLCIDDERRIVLAIENKIGSSEHSNQLRRYRNYLEREFPDHRKILVYLSPDRAPPSDPHYIPFGYDDVVRLVEQCLAKWEQSLSAPVGIALRHYSQMLRRHIVTDEEMADLAKAIYRKHRPALDFIFEQRPDRQLELSELIGQMISDSAGISLDRHVKSYINFFPSAWNDIREFNTLPATEWTKTGRSLLFEIKNTPSSISIALIVGPAEPDIRSRIFTFSREHSRQFVGGNPILSGTWTSIFSRKLVGKNAMVENREADDIFQEFRAKWNDFLRDDFPTLVPMLEEAFHTPDAAIDE